MRVHPRVHARYAFNRGGEFRKKRRSLRVRGIGDTVVRGHRGLIHRELVSKERVGCGHREGAGGLRQSAATAPGGPGRDERGEAGAQAARSAPLPRVKALEEPRGSVGKHRGARGAGVADPAAGGGQHGQRGAAQAGLLLGGERNLSPRSHAQRSGRCSETKLFG